MPPALPLPPVHRLSAAYLQIADSYRQSWLPRAPPLQRGIGSRPYASRIYSAAALSRNGFFFKIVKALPLSATSAAAPPSPFLSSLPPWSPPTLHCASRRPFRPPSSTRPSRGHVCKKCFEFLESPRLVSVSIASVRSVVRPFPPTRGHFGFWCRVR